MSAVRARYLCSGDVGRTIHLGRDYGYTSGRLLAVEHNEGTDTVGVVTAASIEYVGGEAFVTLSDVPRPRRDDRLQDTGGVRIGEQGRLEVSS